MPADVPVITLQTRRLRLREWCDDDLAPHRALNLDRDVRRYFPGLLAPYESDGLAGTLRGLMARQGWGFWAVEELGGAPFIGFIGLAHVTFPPLEGQVEVGWRLARSTWGQGYATEGATAAVHFAFTNLGLRELVSFTVPANQPSRRVMEKLGFVHEPARDFKHPRLAEGHPLQQHVVYRLTFERWTEHQAHDATRHRVEARPTGER